MAAAAMATNSTASSSISAAASGASGAANSKLLSESSSSSGYSSHPSSNSSSSSSSAILATGGGPRARRGGGRQQGSAGGLFSASSSTLAAPQQFSAASTSTGVELNSSDSEDGRGKHQASSSKIMYSTPHYALSSSGSHISKFRRENPASSSSSSSSSFSLFKMQGLKWKNFYEATGALAEVNSASSDEGEKHRRRTSNKATIMRLDKSDMGLYGLCPETDPFYAVVCGICNAVVKPQGLQKHMINRHNNRGVHHNTSTNHTATGHGLATNRNVLAAVAAASSSNLSNLSGHSERSSSEHFSSNQTVSSSSSATGGAAGASTGIGGPGPGAAAAASLSSAISGSNFTTSGSSNSTGSRSKSRSTSKIKGKSGKSSSSSSSASSSSSSSSSHQISNSTSAAGPPSASSAAAATVSFPSSSTFASSASSSSAQQQHHRGPNSAANSASSGHSSGGAVINGGSSNSSAFGAGGKSSSYHSSTQAGGTIAASNSTPHTSTSSGRGGGHHSAQKADSNPKQIKPPLTGTACLSAITQHLNSHGGSPAKGMIAPVHSEVSLSSIPECSSGSSPSSSGSSTPSSSNSSSSSCSGSSSSSSSASCLSSLASAARRTYSRNSKSLSLERKNLPVKDREFDADRHCGVLSGDPPRPCTRSLTCKSHSLTMRRLVNGRTKSFDKLLIDHRTSKDTARNSSVSRAIPELESSNSSSSIEMDRRSSQSVSSNSNLSTEAQPHSSSSSMSPIPPMNSGSDGVPLSSFSQSATNSFSGSSRRIINAAETRQRCNRVTSPSMTIRETTVRVPTGTEKMQFNLSRDDIPRFSGDHGVSNSSPGSTSRSRGRPVERETTAGSGTTTGTGSNPENVLVTTRMIEAERSAVPPELLDDRNFERSVFSPESTILKRPIRLLVDEDPEEYKRARTIDNDIDLMDISKERKLQLKIQHRVQTKNKYRFRAPGEPSQFALSIPSAAAVVAKLYLKNNPHSTVTNAQFILDPETNMVSVRMNGTFEPKELRVNLSRLDRKFLEKTIIDSIKPFGVTVDKKGHLIMPKKDYYAIPNPEDEGFKINHHEPMTEEEYARLRPEFVNGMPKPTRGPPGQAPLKPEVKDENDPIDTSHLSPILPLLYRDLRNIKREIKQEIKQEIKEEPMNEDEMLEYCQPANCLEMNETYDDIPQEVSSIDPTSFHVPTIETRTATVEQQTSAGLLYGEVIRTHEYPQGEEHDQESYDEEIYHKNLRNMLGNRPQDRDLLAAGADEGSNYKVTSNEISINIPLFGMSAEGISNAISSITTGIDIPKMGSQQNEEEEDGEEEDPPPAAEDDDEEEEEEEEEESANVAPSEVVVHQKIHPENCSELSEVIVEDDPFVLDCPPSPRPAEGAPTTVPPIIIFEDEEESTAEPMSVMTDDDEVSYLGVVEAIPALNSRGESIFTSQQEKENTKILLDNNFYDISPFPGDLIAWHTAPPRPLSVNTFGLVKIRGGTAFKKNIVTMRKLKNLSIQSCKYMKESANRSMMKSTRPQRRIIALNTTNAMRRQSPSSTSQATGGGNPFFEPTYTSTNGARPKLEKRSIIMHKGHINKTCKALRSNIVGKLSEQLLGFKKYNNNNNNCSNNNNSAKSINSNGTVCGGGAGSQQHHQQQTYASSNGRCSAASFSKSIGSNGRGSAHAEFINSCSSSPVSSGSSASSSPSCSSSSSSSSLSCRSKRSSRSTAISGGSASTSSVLMGAPGHHHHPHPHHQQQHNGHSSASVRYSNGMAHYRIQGAGSSSGVSASAIAGPSSSAGPSSYSAAASTSSAVPSSSGSKGIHNGSSAGSMGGLHAQPSTSTGCTSRAPSSSGGGGGHRNGSEYN